MDLYDKRIISVDFSKGKEHDFSLFKRTFKSISKDILILADSAYQGICDFHSNNWIPNKKPRKSELSNEEKQENKQLSSYRIAIEHAIRFIKRFKILSSRYRNKNCTRYSLRVSFLSSISNLLKG